ncbi:MAG TPA: hypothetical protein VFZ65_00035 [Planctomycetota bacterium]|nr:hypothetical protein [Planctomycetota bacterium]
MTAGARTIGSVVGKALVGIFFVCYPVLVWLGLSNRSPRYLAGMLLCVVLPVAAFRMARSRRAGLRGLAWAPLVTVMGLLLSATLDAAGFMLVVPVAINAIFLVVFVTSLRSGAMPMVERFARLQRSDLSSEQKVWCRLWTVIWSWFFVANGTTALVLAVAAPLAWWAAYNGLIAYMLMACLFACEWTVRRRRFSRG